MRLKRLETFGFKSFADRMTFDFEDGVTAIIGPNGCGKSNVVDSIKWVIGEQSAKALRGEDMTDVIFNGCATRRAMAFAEVTLVLDQVADRIHAEGIGDEVAITRRLFRDGSSGYYLNGHACRLKDIKELFMDTGVGTTAYSVIEQGRVGFILESNTKDRRLILEEAAGISKYKSRRKLAARKLERVEIDLQRIGEVLAEVRRRVKTVSRQAAAALRWRDLNARAKELRLAFALDDYGRLEREIGDHGRKAGALADAAAQAAAEHAKIEASLAEADTRLVALEAEVRQLETTRADAQSRRDVAQARVKDAGKNLAAADEQERDDREALAGVDAKIAALASAVQEAEKAVAAAQSGTGDVGLSVAMQGRREELDRVLAEVDAQVRLVEDTKAKQIEALREISRVEAELARLEGARTAANDRRKRMEDRSGGQTEQLMGAMVAINQAQDQISAAEAEARTAHAELERRINERETATSDEGRLGNELAAIGHEEARASTALRMLEQQETRADGVHRGVRDVLQAMDRLGGILGMVADHCRMKDDHVLAIETALGGAAQHVITETQSAAKAAIDFLKRDNRGRATFLPLDDIEGGERVPRDMLREPGVVDVASSLVDCDDRVRPAIEHILGNVLVVETLDHAILIRRRHRHGIRLVTLDGEVIAPGGAMTGGRGQGHEAGGLVSRKHEIARLQEELQTIEAKRQKSWISREAARRRIQDLMIAEHEFRSSVKAAEQKVGDARTALMRVDRDRQHLEQATSSFGIELEEIAAELSRIETESKDLTGQRAWFTDLAARLAGEIGLIQLGLEAKGKERDRVQEEVAQLRVSLATSQERIEAARNHHGHLVRAMQELEDGRDERQRRLAGLDARRAELRAVIDDGAVAHAAAAHDVAQAAEALAALVNERDQLRDRTEGSRQMARAAAGRQRELEREQNQEHTKSAEARVRLDGLCQRILEDQQLSLGEAHQNWTRPEDVDWDALKTELTDAEAELTSLGPVNVAAIDELDEVKAREEFLARQFDDLTSAHTKLDEIIHHIDDVSRKLFSDTYREVRTNFQALFRKLFGGGSADLKLERYEMVTIQDPAPAGEPLPPPREVRQEVDILDAGLEIVAQPPGKNPKIITQLSGGEKALTAIALLFAVYQTKPSPFCVLDEVDAPLDDSNVDVYNSMLREFVVGTNADGSHRKGSQFIVITHKKRTMHRADAIYGITQNEPGVSTKISVKFEEVDRFTGELAETTPGKGPYSG